MTNSRGEKIQLGGWAIAGLVAGPAATIATVAIFSAGLAAKIESRFSESDRRNDVQDERLNTHAEEIARLRGK